MPVKIRIEVIGDKGVSAIKPGKANSKEIAIALAHIKLREKELLKAFEKSSTKLSDSKKK